MKLFESIRIGTMEVRNRIVMSPMTTGYAGLDQLPSSQLIAYLVERARGGAGLITTEACVVDRQHREVPHSMHFSSDEVVAPHRALVEAVHEHGARIQPQLVHPGPDSLSPQIEQIPSIGPSVIPSYLTGTPSRELAREELPEILDQYAAAVRRIREAGYDGVELHAAHGYMLLGSFLSPWRNKRSDAYAGRKPEGRLLFLLEVLATIRKEAGDDFPITLRISGYERVAGGRAIDDTARVAPRLVEAGVDAFHVSGGVIDRLTTMIITGAEWGDAHNLSGARAVKNVVDVPVIAVGRIHDPRLAEQLLVRGDADMVAMARPFLADPHFPDKLQRGRSRSIRSCISCENCVDSMERSTMNCAINARCGRETEISLEKCDTPKKVIVVGGGPGGLEAARVAASRGHQVTLYERERFLGGAFVMASTVHPENQPFLEFLLREVARLRVEVRRGHTVTPDEVCDASPDAVVVATGGRVVAPSIPGDDQPHVLSGAGLRQLLAGNMNAEERTRLPSWQRAILPVAKQASGFLTPERLRFLSKVWMPVGKRVAIVGADLAALELAEFLAGFERSVTVLEAGDRLAPEVGHKRRAEHMNKLDRLGVAVNSGVVCERITPTGIAICPEYGTTREVPADTVILAGEVEADTSFYDAISGRVPQAHAIGDCTGLGLVRKATEEAMRIAAAL